MHEHDRRTALQLLEHGIEARVAEVDSARVAEHHDAVEPEVVECVAELGQRAVNIRQGQAGKAAVPVGPVPDHLGGELVAPAGQGTGRGVVAGVHAGGADRGDGDVNVGVIEKSQCARS